MTKVIFAKMNRKVNTGTSLFLFRLLAEQLSPKAQPLPEFCPHTFSAEGLETREDDTEGEKGGQRHMCQCVCVSSYTACPQKVHVHLFTNRDTHIGTNTAAAISAATADPSAIWYER